MNRSAKLVVLSLLVPGVVAAAIAINGQGATARQPATPAVAAYGTGMKGMFTDAMAIKQGLAMASGNGDTHPSKISWAYSSHSQSSTALDDGATVTPEEDVNVVTIVVEGNFVSNVATDPTTHLPLTGKAVIVVFDVTTGRVRESGLAQSPPNLSQSGGSVQSVTGPSYTLG